MKEAKLRISNKTFMKVWIPIILILLALAISAIFLSNSYESSLDNYLGKGKRIVQELDGIEDWDTEFYKQNFETITHAREINSANVALSIAEEGITLLKNDNVLPLKKGSDITPFGLRYTEPLYGGTGSGNVDVSMEYVDTAVEVMNEYFTINPLIQKKLDAGIHYYLPAPRSPGEAPKNWQTKKPEEESATFFENHTWMDEFNPSEVYDQEFLSAADGTVGIIFLGRVGGESNDIYYGKNGSYADGAEHELQLNEYEIETIKAAKISCEKVVVVLETSNVMEISRLAAEEGELSVDAIVWIGGAGAKGFRGMGKVLTGEVNPSGHLPDIWMTSIKDDPVSSNFGEFYYKNLSYNNIQQAMVEYDEGMYYGYRYYETVNDLNGSFFVNGTETGYGELTSFGAVSEKGAVVYPFGYGLSYTDFRQEIAAIDETKTEITLKINIHNTGEIPGRDTVQVYYTPPYTNLDKEYLVEKPNVTLIAYGKTGLIAPGGSETFELSFSKEDMASYSFLHPNKDGSKGCYMLEEGEYILSLRANSHEIYETASVSVESTIWYDGSDNKHIRQSEIDAQLSAGGGNDPFNFMAATNQFPESNEHMAEKADVLSRVSGELHNITESPTGEDLTAPDGMLENVYTLKYFDPETDPILGNQEGSLVYTKDPPVTEALAVLSLADLRGVPFGDAKWDELLDQLDLSISSDVWSVLLASAYTVGEFESIGKPMTTESDGPQGISSMFGDSREFGNAWCSAPILAATFNVDLAYKMGEAVGQEALTKGISAWYAPGLNTHRSPWSGRNFEYYSEDPLLAGYMGANVVSGAADNGLSAVIKHAFLNDQESHRDYISTWANEQVMREIYLKPFEIAIKKSFTTLKYIADNKGTVETRSVRAANGIMTSMGSLGSTYCGNHYNLATNVFRGEMGFRGMIMTDMAENPNYSKDMMLRAGVDEYMYFKKAKIGDLKDYSSPTALNVTRNAVKHIAYMVVNSNAMQGVAPGVIVSYSISPWRLGLWLFNLAVYIFAAIMAVLMVLRTKDCHKNPERYRQ